MKTCFSILLFLLLIAVGCIPVERDVYENDYALPAEGSLGEGGALNGLLFREPPKDSMTEEEEPRKDRQQWRQFPIDSL